MRLAVGRMVTIMVRFVDFGVCLLVPYICTTVHTYVIIICIKSVSFSRYLTQPLVSSLATSQSTNMRTSTSTNMVCKTTLSFIWTEHSASFLK